MKISVVIPARNESRRIDACLKAFERQSLKPFEIIIVDNNSTDDTAERASKYAGVRIVRQPKIGMSFARNAGFNAATGDILARCDVDTWVSPDWIAEINEFFEAHDEVAAVTGPASFYDVPGKLGRPVSWIFLDCFYWTMRRISGGETLFGANCAIKRGVWAKIADEVCTDDANMHEDIDLSAHIKRVGGRIEYDKKLKVGITATTLLHPLGMLRRWKKGLNNFSRHRKWTVI